MTPTFLTTPPTWGLESLAGRIGKTTKRVERSYQKSNPNPQHARHAHDWGFAAGALYKIGHGGAWNSFEYPKLKPMLRGLRGSWGVGDRHSLLATIYWLLTEGHREEFQRDVAFAGTLDPQAYKNLDANLVVQGADDETRWQLRQAQANAYGLRGVDFATWDLIRMIMLSTLGTFVGYLSNDEALDAFAIAQAELQPRYQDWTSLGRDFAVGRWFWSGGEDERLVEILSIVNVLLSDNGPWQLVPYNMPQPRSDGSLVRAFVASGVAAPLSAAQRENATPARLRIDDMIRATGGGFAPPGNANP